MLQLIDKQILLAELEMKLSYLLLHIVHGSELLFLMVFFLMISIML